MSMESTDLQLHKVVVVGHVDHGKSTLLGRILLECGRVPEDRIAHVEKICSDKSLQFEPAFLFDALQEEQEQGISIDTTRVNFEFDGQKFILIDAPGHLEFLKNMTSGASEADLGILVVDGNQGVRSQTERHLKILSMLGIKRVIVALNKVDQIKYSQSVFEEVCTKTREIIQQQEIHCEQIVPISALAGENITKTTPKLDWYVGKPLLGTLLDVVQKLNLQKKAEQPFRMVLQDVYRFEGERLFAGRVVSGTIQVGAEVFFSPSGKMSRIEAIEKYQETGIESASAGESIALRLTEQIFVERGEVISLLDNAPEIDTEFRGRLAWLSSTTYNAETEYLLKMGTAEVPCRVELVDPGTQEVAVHAENLGNGGFSDVIIKTSKPVAFDRAATGAIIEKYVVCTTYETVAAGVVDNRPVRVERSLKLNPNLRHEAGYVERARYEALNNHRGAVLWMTGLSGAGKSSLAKELEKALFAQNCRVSVLDGDNLRFGLCADLGFSPEDRSENIRRIAHSAKLFLDTGFIVITACISPYAKDREVAREIIGAEDFNELFVFCPLEECQRRDPKGLYSKAAAGQVRAVTGFDSPYQAPQRPALRLDSSKLSVDDEVQAVIKFLREKGVLPSENALTTEFSEIVQTSGPRTLQAIND
ncbi:MAG TPA: adenylyl-sulfate kinase [Drouetiella sp.]